MVEAATRNRYPGKCHNCGKAVGRKQGYLLRNVVTWRWETYCEACYARQARETGSWWYRLPKKEAQR